MVWMVLAEIILCFIIITGHWGFKSQKINQPGQVYTQLKSTIMATFSHSGVIE